MGIPREKRYRVQTSQWNVENQTDVFNLVTSKVLKNRNQIKELVIVSVREPAADGYRVLRMEYIRGGRIVDDDRLSKVTANLGEILYAISKK